jgi:type II secretory pathway pseudopilin PulG
MNQLNEGVRERRTAGFNSSGYTYVALLAILVIIGISMAAAGKYWQNVVKREKEEELLFRGDQYRLAIERFYYAIPGRHQYPQSIDELLTDNRTAVGKRHLRRKYKDPMTGEDFVEIRDPLTKRILGVRSGSDAEPLKKSGFDAAYLSFEGAAKYSDWQFLTTIKTTQTSTGVIGGVPGNLVNIPTGTPPR